MATMRVPTKTREASIHAVVIGADGTVVDLGCASYWHKNPLKRWAWRLKRWLRS